MSYYLGLDMGTNSVGWAVTDSQYHLIRRKGKDLWGVREFEEAKTAADRRTHRISRRRREREKARIALLRYYFDEPIQKVDPDFFQRLANSKYWLEDKDECVREKNAIFNDPDYTDRDYYREYPTIFHLRLELIKNAKPHDVRLVYLALLNMFKHRGHFLNASLSGEDTEVNANVIYLSLKENLNIYTDIQLPKQLTIDEIEQILGDQSYSRTEKSERLCADAGITRKSEPAIFELIRGICGLKVDARKIFSNLKDADEKIEIDFSSTVFEDVADELTDNIGLENMEVVRSMKELYDSGILVGILGKGDGNQEKRYLSTARVESYEKHHSDLQKLKSLVKKYCTESEYNKLFRAKEAGSYSAYVNSCNSGGKLRRNMKRGSDGGKEGFYKTVKSLLKKMPDSDPAVQHIQKEIECSTFMPKQLTGENGVIPNQVHVREMKAILHNAEGYLPFLKEKDGSGLTVSERILKLFSFQIPYYVGPVTNRSKQNNGNGWVVRKESGRVLPWTINKKIDLEKTSEEFIERMVKKCTYLRNEDVLPKSSLEYERFCVLNEINNIKIGGIRISVQLKQDIYRDLFERGKRVTRKQLVSYLRNRALINDEDVISGIDDQIHSALISYGRFKDVFGERLQEDSYKKMAEEIIFWCTVFGDSKAFLKKKLKDNYGERLTEKEIKRITGMKFHDWGKLSKQFLELRGVDKSTGEELSLIRAMWNTNFNLMELLHSSQFTFGPVLAELTERTEAALSTFKLEDLDEYYFSAPVKRMVWQTLKIIRELEDLFGEAPECVFIEMTRSHDEKPRRTKSRGEQFMTLYKDIIKENPEWKTVIQNAEDSGKIRSKKMYLYLTQMGRDMYTGEKISLDHLFESNIYDLDHIYPRQYVKDDNLANNLVLVNKPDNNNKSNDYPLPPNIRSRQHSFWKMLLDHKLITAEKYRRLTGSEPFTDYQMAGFIARQMVETSQGAKGVADILHMVLPGTKIVYAKARNVSDFRQQYKLPKCRIVNDLHHAHDAYLNIVVGNVYDTKFTQDPLHFIQSEYRWDHNKYHYHLGRMFEQDVKRNGKTAWIAPNEQTGKSGTIQTVKQVLEKPSPIFSRMTFVQHGALANETLYGRRKAKPRVYVPLKMNDEKMKDVNKYGGFTSTASAYFFLVEHTKKKRIRTLETVPLAMLKKIKNNSIMLQDYCIHVLHLKDPDIRIPEIKFQSMIKRDGFYYYLSGTTGNRILLRNAVNLFLDTEGMIYAKNIEKYADRQIIDEHITKENNIKLFMELVDKHQNTIFSKRVNNVGNFLADKINAFEALELEEQCKVLYQVFLLTRFGLPTKADLTQIGGKKNAGVMLCSNNISNCNEMKLIQRSASGVEEKQIDLLKV